jgi:hypothetical protein
LDADFREMKYPSNVYFTGFAYRAVEKDIAEEIKQAKLDAQADLVKQIRLVLQSKMQNNTLAQSINGKYDEVERFENKISAEASAEIVGMKTETHIDTKSKLVYAFAYANKYEAIGYYKSNLSMNINQIESFLKTAQDLEINAEKSKARQQVEMAKPFFSKVHYEQEMLIVFDSNISSDDMQQSKMENLYNQFTQMQARLAQAVYVFVESNENLFGKNVDIVANKVKSDLSVNGCSFVENTSNADFLLKITASTRSSSTYEEMIFCFVDVTIELFDNHKQKVVYSDEIVQKGGSNSLEKAGRKVMSDVAAKIVEKINNWIK